MSGALGATDARAGLPQAASGSADAFDAVVVGAGMAGLSAASALVGAGRRVLVLDKGRGVGGRLATRRLGAAIADHGAQYFRVRSAPFGDLVAAARAAGAVTEWCLEIPESTGDDGAAVSSRPSADGSGGGLPVWRGSPGMTAPAKWLAESLAAGGVVIRTSTRATAIAVEGDRVVLHLDDGPPVTAAGAVLTPPVPQVLDLLAAGGLVERLLPGTRERLAAVSYEPCFALLLVLDRPSLVPPPGGIRFPQSGGRTAVGVPTGFPLAWIADNQLKGISPIPCLTLHATAAFSRDRFDAAPEEVIAELVEAARPWIDGGTAGSVAGIAERSLHRWKYAFVARGCEGRFLPVLTGRPVAVCGDAFGGPRVEAAAESGLAAGLWLAGRLG